MSYQRGQYNFDESTGPSNFAEQLGLTNLGLTIFPLVKGEGFDFFHSHREQEEIYLCLEGSAVLLIKEDDGSVTELQFKRGEVVRVEPQTLRAVGNLYASALKSSLLSLHRTLIRRDLATMTSSLTFGPSSVAVKPASKCQVVWNIVLHQRVIFPRMTVREGAKATALVTTISSL